MSPEDMSPQEQERYAQAKKRVGELRDFYNHLTAYVVVNLFLLVLNLLTSPGSLWFYWVMIPWGLGLAIHAANTFSPFGDVMGKEWEERKIREFMGEDAPKPKNTPSEDYFEEN